MIKAFEAAGEDAVFTQEGMTLGEFLQCFMLGDLSSYIDWDSGKVSFLSEDFIRLLEFSRNFSNSFDSGAGAPIPDPGVIEAKAEEGSLFLYDVFTDLGFTWIQDKRKLYEGLGGAVIMSAPSKDRNRRLGMRMDSSSLVLSITEQCRDKEAAWEFVRSFLTYEEQISECYYMHVFPVRQDVLNKCLEYFTAKEDYKDGERYIQALTPEPFGEEDVEMVKDIVSRISSCSLMDTANEEIYKIVEEEASAFYSGDKTAEETAY